MVYPPPSTPTPPKRPKDQRWPAPIPFPTVPPEDIGKILKQILDRLDAIEKRLDNIEKLLVQIPPKQ
jgi:tetrahydromethanopterin S-methyltransferase subunit G